MPKAITIREYDRLGWCGGDKVKPIEKSEFEEIRAYVANNPDPEGRWVIQVYEHTLRAKNYVGVVQTRKGTTIEILPKVDLAGGQDTGKEREIFLNMLRHWRDSPCRALNNADIRAVKDFPLLEAFIDMFLKDMRELTRRGLACAYGEIEENRHYLKGKLMMAQHLRQNLVHRERFYVRYEIFSPNRPINRLLKSALLLLQRASRRETNRAEIRRALFYFEDIPHSADIDTDLIRARVDRTMPLYDRLFPWARLFLKRAAPATWRDNTPAIALLFPMERIFEDYVAHLVARAAPGWQVNAQDRAHWLLDENWEGAHDFRLRPDIVARNSGSILVMDTKWKRLNTQKSDYGISQADLYQLYAYGKKYRAEGAKTALYLLYPFNEDFKGKIECHYDSELQLTAFPVKLALKDKETIADLGKLFPDAQSQKAA